MQELTPAPQHLAPLKLHMWMNFPSHHQSGLFASLRRQGVDLQVTYYERVPEDRVALGWSDAPRSAGAGETSLSELRISHLQRLRQLRDYVHVIPGYGSRLLRELAREASRHSIRWCHWSEASRTGLRWWLRYPTKRRYAALCNRHGVGAFAQGHLARRDFIRWGIDAHKIADLSYSVSPADEHGGPDPRITEFAAGRGVFLFVGRLDYNKAIDVQLHALRRVQAHDWCLVLVGSDASGHYRRLAQRLQLSQQVLFLPPVPWEQVAPLYRAANVLLLPSRYEGWGVVVNEAAAQSRALIVSTACGAAWHLVEPGINGLHVTPGSVDSLCAAMHCYVGGGKALATAHGRESQRICARYSCDASARRLITALHTWSAC